MPRAVERRVEEAIAAGDAAREIPRGRPVRDMIREKTYFYNQTVGLTFVWTLENVVLSLISFALFLVVDGALGGGVLVARWLAVSLLGSTLLMGAGNVLTAFLERNLEVFSRHYMMVTQAYCGMVSCLGTVYSAVAWRAARSAAWRGLFVQSDAEYLEVLLLLLVVANNVQWLLSLVLTYSCTPFGASNSAFLKVPVAAGLVLFLVLVNETVNNGLMVCQGAKWDVFTYTMTNAAVVSSFVLHCLSAVEFDYWEVLPRCFHSTLTARAQYDVWAIVHGLALVFVLVAYGCIARLSRFTFFGVVGVLGFIVLTTVLQGIDLYRVARQVFQTDDADEQILHGLEETMATEFVRARDAPRGRGLRRRRGGRRSPVALSWSPDGRGRSLSWGEGRASGRSLSWGEGRSASGRSLSPGSSVADAAHVRAHGAHFAPELAPPARPSAVALFPNIPVGLRRTRY